MNMKRTTIMLPVELRVRALQQAHRKKVSLGELIRESLWVCLRHPKGPTPQDPLFSDRAVFRRISPRDLAKNHDRYLYGEHPL